MKQLSAICVAALASLALAAPAVAADATLFGGATQETGQVSLVANVGDASTTNDFSGINFTNTGVTTFSTLTQLSTRFNVTDDDCGAGSPRFQIRFAEGNVFVYLGPSPTFRDCLANTWVDSGNLIGNNDACRWDTAQIVAGTQCNTYTGALAILASRQVLDIQLVVDASWDPGLLTDPAFADREQTVLVCGIRINANTFFPCAGQGKAKANPARMCREQRDEMGEAAFREAWGTNPNKRNAFGKCVSTMAKAKRNGEASELQTDILAAIESCKAEGKTGADLGKCVKAKVKADVANATKSSKGKGKGKSKGRK